MKKLGLLFKEISGSQIKQNLKDSNSFLIVKYSGLSSPDLSALRQTLKTAKANFFVVRNNVARRIFKDSGYQDLVKFIEGPCGLIFVKEEPVDTSRVLYNFAKEHEHLKVEAGLLNERLLTDKDIEVMAKLPGKEALKAKVVMALAAPLSGLVGVLSATLSNFVVCLERIKEKILPLA